MRDTSNKESMVRPTLVVRLPTEVHSMQQTKSLFLHLGIIYP